MRFAAAVLILCLISGGALAAGFILPREPAIDILDGPAYASADAYLADLEAVNPQDLGLIDLTDTTTLPTGEVIHPYGANFTLTCTYLNYYAIRTTDLNGYILFDNLHWGVYELVQTSTPVAQVINRTRWEFGWMPDYPKRLVICAIDLSPYAITRDSPARDSGYDWGQTEDFYGNPIVGIPDRGVIEWQPGWP